MASSAVSPDHSIESPPRAGWWAGLWFVAAVGLCGWYRPTQLPLLRDSQHYYFIAERYASGVMPHVSQFDPKPGLSMMMTGWAIQVGRFFGTADITSARVISGLVIASTIAVLFALARRLFESTRAGHLAALGTLSFAGFFYMGTMGARPKVFLVFFLVLTLASMGKGRFGRVGFFAALTTLCWQMGALTVVAAAVVAILRPQRRTNLIRLALGFALPLAAYQLYFWWNDAWSEQYLQSVVFPVRFMSEHAQSGAPWSDLWHRWNQGFGATNVLPWLALAGVLRGGVWLGRHQRWRLPMAEARADWMFVVVAGMVIVVFTVLDNQGFPDLFYPLPIVALAVAGLLAPTSRSPSRGWNGIHAFFALGAVTLAVLGPRHFAPEFTLTEQQDLARQIDTLRKDDDTLYALGCTHLLAFQHTDNFTPYGFIFRGVEEYLGQLDPPHRPYQRDDQEPDVVLSSRSIPESILGWLHTNYDRERDPQFARQSIRIWRRKRSGGE